MTMRVGASVQVLVDFLNAVGIEYTIEVESGDYEGILHDSKLILCSETEGVVGYRNFIAEFYIMDGYVVQCGVWE